MKRLYLFSCILLAILLLTFPLIAHAEGTRKLTLMVYMCGSNLETTGGSASADIREMLEAAPAGRDVTVLVMTGGSGITGGTGYFQPGSTGIYEIGAGGRIRQVLQSPEKTNMGDQETLTSFLRYGQENRPAQSYALILWNHGGGPLEGVCWDEVNDMDHLTLREVTGALENGLTQRLNWIGFDACLMGSLEVAGELAPYADYMIASQETEPATGWNYSFLRDLGSDADGAETGKRIVDAYFEGQETSGETLTLSCIDLPAATEAIQALDPVFAPLSERLDREKYLSLSGLRMTTTGFGKADPGYSATGYDLVDVTDLVEKIEQSDATEELLSRLNRAVVCSRANEEGANGLTLYYPYANQTGYLGKWKETYAELTFSPGYQAYVEAFGSMLTGETLFRWLDLIPEAGQPAEDGTCSFTLPLTEEQAENVVSAQLLILGDTGGNRLEDNCVLLASARAEFRDDRSLQAVWDGRCLYAEQANGELTGPISFQQTDDGKRNTVIARYNLEDNYQLEGTTAFIELNPEDASEYPEILRIRVWDEATNSFSSRMTFSEENYGAVMFWNLHRAYPGVGADRVLPGMEEWPQDSTRVFAQGFALPQQWKLRFVRQDSGRQLYAMFRLLDSQQKVICSLPVAVPNRYRQEAASVSGDVDTPLLRASLACAADSSPDTGGLYLEWTLENPGEESVKVRLREPVLNGKRITNADMEATVRPGRTVLPETVISLYDTAGLDSLTSVSGTLEVTPANGETENIPFLYTFGGADLSSLQRETAAETEQNGITLRLLGWEEDERCGWIFHVLAENNGTAGFRPTALLVNNIAFSSAMPETLLPGESRVLAMHADNGCSSISLGIEGSSYQTTYLEDDLLQSLGMKEIREMTILTESEDNTQTVFSLPLAETIPLKAPETRHTLSLYYPVWDPPEGLSAPQTEEIPMLAENSTFRVRLRRLVAGETGLSMSLAFENLSDRWIKPEISSCTVNGQPVSCGLFLYAVPPHSTRVTEATLNDIALREKDSAIREIVIGVYENGNGNSVTDMVFATLKPDVPFSLGEKGGTWINGEEFTAETAMLPEDLPEEIESNPRVLAEDLLIPENAASLEISLDTGIDPGKAAEIQNCKAAVIRKNAAGYYEILTLQDLHPDEDGKVIFRHPGLFPTVDGDPDIGVMTYLIRMDEEELLGEVFLGASVGTESMETVQLDGIRWLLHRRDNTAEIVSFEQDKTPYTKQSEILTASFLTYEILPEAQEDGTLPHLADLHRRDDFEWFLNAPGIRLEKKPLRLALRPITAEDDLYVLISVLETDGARYSLPMIPYPVQ